MPDDWYYILSGLFGRWFFKNFEAMISSHDEVTKMPRWNAQRGFKLCIPYHVHQPAGHNNHLAHRLTIQR
ncbi:MAG TPA: hypothetical protein PK763_09490, partial [Anaerolineaceae bacterium]|nr:hypothetical protein [Anaerolineaceae bacterium]